MGIRSILCFEGQTARLVSEVYNVTLNEVKGFLSHLKNGILPTAFGGDQNGTMGLSNSFALLVIKLRGRFSVKGLSGSVMVISSWAFGGEIKLPALPLFPSRI